MCKDITSDGQIQDLADGGGGGEGWPKENFNFHQTILGGGVQAGGGGGSQAPL